MSPPPSNASTVCATGQTAQVDVGQERTAAGKLVGCAAGKLVRGSAQARDLLAEAEVRRRSCAQPANQKEESGILRLGASIRSIDAEMTDKGFDVGALLQLQAQRDEVSCKIEAFIAERERLMIVLVSACTLTRVPGPQTYMYIYMYMYRYIYVYI